STLAPAAADGHVEGTGDPMEIALLVAARAAGIERAALLREQPELRAEAFETGTMMMATFHRRDDGMRIAVKGAPEAVLKACSHLAGADAHRAFNAEARHHWQKRNEALASEGLRVLALAERQCPEADCAPYEELTLVALVGLVDPPRRDVRDAVDRCRNAGIELVMVTGDQPQTARYVAREIGLVDHADAIMVMGARIHAPAELSEQEQDRLRSARIFARVSPEQKLDLIALHQNAGAVVAMTGDGVNDAPALKKADIGIAMGRRGTQVAREAADMVLTDDALQTIVLAVEQGRIIFGNIRQFVLYLLSCNVSEVMVIALATVAQAPLPILPLQILFLNLVTDVFPALALGVGPGDPALMKRAPRPSAESVLTRRHWLAVAGYGLLITLSVLTAFAWSLLVLQVELRAAVTISFLTLAFAQLWHVFNMRESSTGILRNDITRNVWVWAALALCVLLLVAAAYLPPLARILAVTPPGREGWALVLVCSALPLVIGQLLKSSSRQ
ncbi:MAG TPA: HAD-IC family P-type ATPase, partial [Gammaproteobacteria bacterium]|nr:HAD-IC family P-type ATPase [Gammaproteobacteria bacterium]